MSEDRSCETCSDGNVVGGCRLAIPDFTPDLQCWSPSPADLQKENSELKLKVYQLENELRSIQKDGWQPYLKTALDGKECWVRCMVFRVEHGSPPSVWVDPEEVKNVLKKAGKE